MRIGVFLGAFPSLSETFVLNQLTGLIDRGHTLDLYPSEASTAPFHHADVDRYRLLDRIRYVPDPPPTSVASALAPALALLGRGSTVPLAVLHPVYRRSGSRRYLLHEAADFPPNEPYDVLYAPFGPEGLRAARLKRLGVIEGALATAFHGYDLTLVPRAQGPKIYELLFDEAVALLPCSDDGRRRLLDLGAPPERTHVHRMGIDLNDFRFTPRSPSPPEPVRLLSVARLVEKKGLADAVRAVAVLAAERDIRYDIVGGGPERTRLERLIGDLGLVERIRLLGTRSRDDVRRAMREAHVFLAPSFTATDGDIEGIPVVLMEAMASGLPVVSTVHGGIPELIEDGRTGRLVAEHDVDAFAAALEELIDTPEAALRYAEAGRAVVEAHHNIDALNDRLATRFEALAA